MSVAISENREVSGERRQVLEGIGYDAYRKIADPAIRRASLWITAWELMRERRYCRLATSCTRPT